MVKPGIPALLAALLVVFSCTALYASLPAIGGLQGESVSLAPDYQASVLNPTPSHLSYMTWQFDNIRAETSGLSARTSRLQTDNADSPAEKELKRRKGRAFLRSVVLPGWGQLAEGKRSGYAFLTAEALLVSCIIGSRIYASWLEDDYKTFAAQHAGISGDKSHQFYVDIGNWMDQRSYNEKRLQGRQYDDLYTDTGSAWEWDSDESRRDFKGMRLSSDNTRQLSILLVGGLLLNHLVSGIEAGRGIDKEQDISIIMPNPNTVGLRYTLR